MEPEDLVNKIINGLKKMSNNINVIEQEVDVEVQLKYFEFSRTLNKKIKSDEIDQYIQKLSEETDHEALKETLILLSHAADVKAFRAIEDFVGISEGDIKEWSKLALNEAKIILEGDLLGENKLFISTGLGGSGSSLRYFIVLFANSENSFQDFQKKIINTEISALFKEYNAVNEELNVVNNFVTLVALIPLEVPLNELFRRLVEAINEYGDFMSFSFLINNAKRMTNAEIAEFLEKEKKQVQDTKGGTKIDKDSLN